MICPDRTIHPKPSGATLRAFDIPVITCSWRQEANVNALVGEVAGHLLKPELLYTDFEAALREAGVEVG